MCIKQEQYGIVPKTVREICLNDVYMRWIKSDVEIPLSVVNRFKKDVEEIRKENQLYNQKTN